MKSDIKNPFALSEVFLWRSRTGTSGIICIFLYFSKFELLKNLEKRLYGNDEKKRRSFPDAISTKTEIKIVVPYCNATIAVQRSCIQIV
ncbi:TPA: hypothetical protein DEO28_03985 [Candidatus Dependentiae bacterium]|nr:MAG: hypothetical protein UR14_C0006G0034 [candidate division TM6 bacterium GW2011_GWE2_31_21]KKP53543.1 MAG: hypothetical protein UR43_C0004G0084 [candidate division TM6 bacterium GW2011_GWF2_33_332]HBS48216.1 hypothetical protein [Candidatus Dependentiae bacterium]HBZ73642.1 hypothetical protein [Candidatus Dependentiae bacterium]